MAIKWSGARPGDVAVDLCCGSGDLAFNLAETVGPSGEVPAACAGPICIPCLPPEISPSLQLHGGSVVSWPSPGSSDAPKLCLSAFFVRLVSV